MATTTNRNRDLDSATAQFRELNDRVAETGRKVGTLYLDTYEKAVEGFVSAELKLAERAPVELTGDLVKAHAGLTQDLTKVYVKAAREALA